MQFYANFFKTSKRFAIPLSTAYLSKEKVCATELAQPKNPKDHKVENYEIFLGERSQEYKIFQDRQQQKNLNFQLLAVLGY